MESELISDLVELFGLSLHLLLLVPFFFDLVVELFDCVTAPQQKQVSLLAFNAALAKLVAPLTELTRRKSRIGLVLVVVRSKVTHSELLLSIRVICLGESPRERVL